MKNLTSNPQNNISESYTITKSSSKDTLAREFATKIEHAKQSTPAMDSLLAEYLPFIRQEACRNRALSLETDDRVSFGMITFVNCVRLYDESRGSFLSYVSTAIRNRLLDEAKKQARHALHTVPLEREDAEDNTVSFQYLAAAREHEYQQQRTELAEEIDRFSARLAEFGVEMASLDIVCPKHHHLRYQCVAAARLLAFESRLAQRFTHSKRLPISDLSRLSGLSAKTLERCRRYIVAITVILMGDFPGIEHFLPAEEEL